MSRSLSLEPRDFPVSQPADSSEECPRKQVITLLPKPWKLFCNRRSCVNGGEWVDYYGFCAAGGYEDAQLLYVKDVDWGMRPKNQGKRPQPKDVLLEANGYNLAGVCTYFIYAVMEQFWKENAALELTVVDGAYFNGNCDLVQFMQDNAFPAGSFKEGLQLRVRRAVYQQFPPVTSRLPTADEAKETYPFAKYVFWNEKDVEERVEKHRFLERGEYKGCFYGTLVPVKSKNVAYNFFESVSWLWNPPPARRLSFKKAIGMVPVDFAKDVSEEDLGTYAPVQS